MDEVKAEIWRLVQDEHGRDVVLLRDEQRRHLPIWIGRYEAAAIWAKLDPRQANALLRRPMTHDLCTAIIERLGGRIERIVIDDFSNDTYYAKIYLMVDGRQVVVDSRPSDAIALALRCGAPVWVSDRIMDSGNVAVEEDEPAQRHPLDGEPTDDEPAADDSAA